ncbi:hypothetical protein M3J09_007082 [Ascochyta lentis]
MIVFQDSSRIGEAGPPLLPSKDAHSEHDTTIQCDLSCSVRKLHTTRELPSCLR